MSFKHIIAIAAAAALLGCGSSAPKTSTGEPVTDTVDQAILDQPAPDFTLTDISGAEVTLSQYRGQTVILEWFNPQCPFIVYAHGEGPLSEMGEIPGAGDASVVWLAINSGAPGKQGHGLDLNIEKHSEYGMSYPVLIDEDGKVGKLYGAKTTPHIFIIDQDGSLVYNGALDNAPLGNLADDGVLTSHVATALSDMAGTMGVIENPKTKPYGCSVKY
jgi:hypothetical protein